MPEACGGLPNVQNASSIFQGGPAVVSPPWGQRARRLSQPAAPARFVWCLLRAWGPLRCFCWFLRVLRFFLRRVLRFLGPHCLYVKSYRQNIIRIPAKLQVYQECGHGDLQAVSQRLAPMQMRGGHP